MRVGRERQVLNYSGARAAWESQLLLISLVQLKAALGFGKGEEKALFWAGTMAQC